MANCSGDCASNDPRRVIINIDGKMFEASDLMESIETAEQIFQEFTKNLVGGSYSFTDGNYRELTMQVSKNSCLDLYLRSIPQGQCLNIGISDYNQGGSETLSCTSARLMKIGSRQIASSSGNSYTFHGEWLNI